MVITKINSAKIRNAKDLIYRKIELCPPIADMFAREQEMSPKKAPWLTGKIKVIPAIADIFTPV